MAEGEAQPSRGAAALEGYQRYAIYYAPRPGDALAVFGEGWLGRGEDGSDRPRIALEGLPVDPETLTADARRYGLHGTLKAPFELAPGVTATALDAALETFAAARPAACWPGWRLTGEHGFTSLRPHGPCPALEALAAAVAAHFAPFGAPPSPESLAKRRAAGLSIRQETYLAVYGYPYVFEEFGFHVTLSGRLEPPAGAALREALAPPLASVLRLERVWIEDLCLFGDPGGGEAFRLLRRHPLAAVR